VNGSLLTFFSSRFLLLYTVQESLPRNWCCLQWAVSSHIYQHLRQLTIDQPDLDNSSTETLPSGKYQFAVKANQHSHFECLTVRVVVLIELGVIGSKVTGL
jgi:hypothetical protein